MIDFINYYFDLYPQNINYIDEKYMFYINNDKYYLIFYDDNIDKLDNIVKLNIKMVLNGSLVHEIIFNKFKGVLSNYNGKDYILFRVYINENKKVTIDDVMDMLNEYNIDEEDSKLERLNWPILWENKIDYIEYQMLHVIKKYPLLYSVIDYYIGLAENAISYLYEIVPLCMGDIEIGICHKRIGINSTLFDLYNPLNLIIDYKVRDLAEYTKDSFLNGKDVSDKIFKRYFFDKLNLSLFISRLLFPSYFFDIFDKIVFDEIKERSILDITKKSSSFEDFLNNLIRECNLKTITWLSK